MDKRRKLLIISFYLAKFNVKAIQSLGFASFREAFNEIGAKLDYSPNSVKNRRDDFDPLFEHRAGWYQVELNKSNLEIVDQFDHLSEEALKEIVLDLLNEVPSEEVFLPFTTRKNQTSIYTTRGVTGKRAEEFFIEWFSVHFPKINLIDTRDLGCGYDFSTDNSEQVYEVKGLSRNEGGVLFTDKEWKVAAELQGDYYLVLIKDCFGKEPIVEIYSNPHKKFNAKKQISTVINVNWGINSRDFKNTEID